MAKNMTKYWITVCSPVKKILGFYLQKKSQKGV